MSANKTQNDSIYEDDDIRAPRIKARAEFGVGDVVPVFLESRGWRGKLKVFLTAPDFVKVRRCLPNNLLKVQPSPASTLCWEISVDKPASFEFTVTVRHARWTWEIRQKVTACRLHRLGLDPTIAFFMLRYHEDEAGYLARENYPKVCAYRDEYPLARALQDFGDSKINTLIMTASSGSLLKEDYVETEWFTKYVSGCHAQGIRVGICLPFADTYDNYITSRDADVQQRTHTGKLCAIEDRVAVVQMDAPAFVEYARTLIGKCSLVGVDIIDYAEPDYWPEKTTGHDPYIKRRWKKNFKQPFPNETSPQHRLFMEDSRIQALTGYSRFIHALGLADHLTASPFGHCPALICQNYGKYSRTPITEFSSTYHNAFGNVVKQKLLEKKIPAASPGKPDSIGCLEVRFMGQWTRRHGVYINTDRPAVLRDRITICAFLHNMDIFFWEYPQVTGKGGITAPEPGVIPAEAQKQWEETKALFSEKFGAYLGLPPEYHASGPYPHIFMAVSKRIVYFNQEDWVFDAMYRNGLRLIDAHLPFGILWPEFAEPLTKQDTPVKVLMLGEDVPVSNEFLLATAKWHGRGKALIYFGGPSYDWATGQRLRAWPAVLEKMLKPAAKQKRVSLKEFILEHGDGLLPGHETNPAVTVTGDPRTGLSILVDSSAAAISAAAYAMLVETVAKLVDAKPLDVETEGDIEVYVHKNKRTIFISAFNHGAQEANFRIGYRWQGAPARLDEIISGQPVHFGNAAGRITFAGRLKSRAAAIYRLK
ncbi:MAG: hypothetical protein Q7J98_05030 [Kiritimatiellia bacterium]|nr:hypothetical protein [Kiritimatiellia bacterium]